MGYGSAGREFEVVAQALIDAGAGDEIRRKVCARLIRYLRDEDWDTAEESLEAFAHDTPIVSAFEDNGIRLFRA